MYLKSLLFLLIIFWLTGSFAQGNFSQPDTSEASHWIDQGNMFKGKRKPDSALYYYQKADTLWTAFMQKGRDSTTTQKYVEIFLECGKLSNSLKEFRKAIAYWEKADSVIRCNWGDYNYQLPGVYFQQGIAWYNMHSYQAAARVVKHGISVLRDHQGEKSPDLARNLNALGIFYNDIQWQDSADFFHKKALAMRLALFEKPHPDIFKSYLNLGVVKSRQRKFDSAYYYTNLAIDMEKQLNGEESARLIGCYRNLGADHYKAREFEPSLENYQKALRLTRIIAGKDSRMEARIYADLFTVLSDAGRFDEAEVACKNAMRINLNNFGSYLGVDFERMSKLHSYRENLDSAVFYIQKAISMAEKDEKAILELRNYYNGHGILLYKQGKYDQAKQRYEQVIEIVKNIYGDDTPEIAKVYGHLSMVYGQLGNNQKQRELLDQAFEIYKKRGESIGVAYIFGKYGSYFDDRGDYPTAKYYFNRELVIRKKFFREGHHEMGDVINNLGTIYYKQNQLEKTLEHFEQAQAIWEAYWGSGYPYLGIGYSNIGSVQRRLKKYEKSLESYDNAIAVFKKHGDRFISKIATVTGRKGAVYAEKNAYKQGIKLYNEGIDILMKGEGNNQYDLGYLEKGLANLYYRKGDFVEAMDHLNLGQSALVPSLIEGQEFSQVDFDSLIVDRFMLLEILKMRYKVELAMTKKEKAANTLELIIAFIDFISKEAYNASSRRSFINSTSDTFEDAIEEANEAFLKTGDTQKLYKAFEYAERTRAVKLRESLEESQHLKSEYVPDSILKQYQQYKLLAGQYKRIIEEAKASGKTYGLDKDITRMYSYQDKSDSMQQVIRLQFPIYFQTDSLEGKTEDYSLKEPLTTDEAILEYFIGDNSLFLFVLTSDTIALYKQSIKDSATFKKNLSDFSKFIATAITLDTALLNQSWRWYMQLVAPAQPLLTNKSLRIVPDEGLYFLPFELLVSKRCQSLPENRDDIPFLVKKHVISYAYAASLETGRAQTNGKYRHNNRTLALAPYARLVTNQTFASSRADTTPLPFSKMELVRIEENYPCDAYLNQDAHKQLLLEKAGDYQIIHISSHGEANSGQPLSSKIYLPSGPDSSMKMDLYGYEIFSLPLNAEMVVLSACETGLGHLQKGEGLMSLGRAFAAVGVSSQVASLWIIDDQSTAEIMGFFYKNLADGMARGKALQQAKLSYLKVASADRAHPALWAGMVIYGETGPLTQSASWSWLYIVLGLGLVVGFLFLLRKRSFNF